VVPEPGAAVREWLGDALYMPVSYRELEAALVEPRDYNGMRGPVPTTFGAMSWQDAAHWRRVFDKLRGYARRDRRPSTGRGRFARGTFRVRL
jgi:hypothetical protein